MSIKITSNNKWNKTTKWMKTDRSKQFERILKKYAERGLRELYKATPKDTGKTANSWSYELSIKRDKSSIIFTNYNLADNGMPIALYIQYGHGTKNGGYVKGVNYITPALKPIFEEIANEAWREVTNG